MAATATLQKIELKLDLNGDKDKQRALKAVSTLHGIHSLSVGDDKMTVIGVVDPVVVVSKLRKNGLPSTQIYSVTWPKKKKEGDKKAEASKPPLWSPPPPLGYPSPYPQLPRYPCFMSPPLTSKFAELYSDLKAWLAVRNQRQKREVRHKCVEQGIPQLHGRDKIREVIIEEILLNRNCGKCNVLSIYSESGLGKTALLRVLYNDQQLLYAFDTRIWIEMSNNFDTEMLFRKIIESVTHVHCRINNLSLLEEMVKEVLGDRKFLFLLDDADIEDQHFWTTMIEVLSAGSKDSVIVIATRSVLEFSSPANT